jgi:hypothetical protein
LLGEGLAAFEADFTKLLAAIGTKIGTVPSPRAGRQSPVSWPPRSGASLP